MADFAMDLIDAPILVAPEPKTETPESSGPQQSPNETQNETKLELLIDDREHDILKILSSGVDLNYKRQRLNAGDFIGSWKNQIIFVIERKTWADLAASFKDGRKENIEKLKDLRNQTGCKIFYLMEGSHTRARTQGIQTTNLQSHLDHLSIRDDVHVIYTLGLQDTINRISVLMQNTYTYLKKLTEKQAADAKRGGLPTRPKPTEDETRKKLLYRLWEAIPGVSQLTATLFIENKIKLNDFLLKRYRSDDIYTLKFNSGAIVGERLSKIAKICDFSNPRNTQIYIRILSEIPGVSKVTAPKILKVYPFKDILSGAVTHEMLANIEKSQTKKIGNKAAGLICTYLIKSDY